MKNVVRFVIFVFVSLSTVLFFTFCRKSNLGSEYEGIWASRAGTAQMSVKNGHVVYGSVSQDGKTKSATGIARIDGNKMHIGTKKIPMQAAFTEMPLGKGAFNYFVILDGDTLFKSPIISGVDNFCFDGIQNNGETGVDCGGKCSECGTVEDCDDGVQTPGETGIDCGGICEPCTTNACNVQPGFGENAYLSSGSAVLVDSLLDPTVFMDDAAHKVVLNFPAGSTCKGYEISFYNEVFLYMAENMTQKFKTYTKSVIRKESSCLVEVVMKSGEHLTVQAGQSVYVIKTSEGHFNIKFCNLEADKTTNFNLNTKFSANANFQLHKL